MFTSEEPPALAPNNPLAEVQLSYPYRYTAEAVQAPTGAEVTEFERSPEGYLELEWQYRDAQRALALDFEHFMPTTGLSREELERQAAPQIEQLNARRSQLENPPEPVSASGLSEQFLLHLIRPEWQANLPQDDSPESQSKWEEFKGGFPEHMQINLEELAELDGKMRVLSNDQNLQEAVRGIHSERIEVMRIASAFIGADRKIDGLMRKAASLYRDVGVSDRTLTTAERRYIDRLDKQAQQIRESRGQGITTPEVLEQVQVELRKRIDIQRRRDFEQGLVLTEQMRGLIDELLPSLAQGSPALLVGETGGAKTALAEYISRRYFNAELEFISGYADINSYQVMGKMSLRNEEGSTVSDFVPGPVMRAMEKGVPLILDEITAMPSDFLKRLNKIMQLRPGDKFVAQEDSGREVTIKPGFVIIATANEKSKRYKGIDDLSVELLNRFGANVIRVNYPDTDVIYGQAPVENAMIAKAALTDRSGNLVGGIDMDELERFVRAAHITQQVFVGNFGRGFSDFVNSENIADNKPGLDDTVLAPRTMVALLQKVRDSHGKVTLDQTLRRFVSGVKSDNDRKQITTILKGQGFFKEES